jgi:hypothetical protein
MIVIFVHGWSVQDTHTYGELPAWLQSQGAAGGLPIEVGNVYLGKYISFDDSVTLDDIGRAFDQAIRDELAAKGTGKERFACITHSTGGPVVRKWMDLFWKDKLARCPLSHLVMLAPANHGSALAQLGKSRIGRIKSFVVDGVAPGERVLDWLELGSEQSWALNQSWLEYECVEAGVYPFVLAGQRIDRGLYDALNSYTDEAGSDGVVRAAAANLNYGYLRVLQQEGDPKLEKRLRTARTAFGILPGQAHSGNTKGIIRSVTLANAGTHPTAQWVLRCLRVGSARTYAQLVRDLDALTGKTQTDEARETVGGLFRRTYTTSRYSMIVFRVVDDRGEVLSDYDLFLTAGPDYSEQDLPPGFFVDRQRNRRHPGKLTYYVDYDVLRDGLKRAKVQGKLGFRVVARPTGQPGERLVFYQPLDFRSTFDTLSQYLVPNETVMVELQLRRCVDATVFRMTNDLKPGPIEARPSGALLS